MKEIIIFLAIAIGAEIYYKKIYSPDRKVGHRDTMPINMLHEHYCSRCGTILDTTSYAREVHPGDPDWKHHSYSGRHSTAPIGYIEVTEYVYRCPYCDKTQTIREQYAIEKAQKRLGKHVLTNDEITEAFELYNTRSKRVGMVHNIVRYGIWSFVVAAIMISVFSKML